MTTEIPNQLSEQEIEENRRLAEVSAPASQRYLDLLLEEHSVAFRWLMASFLAINSGGLFVLKDISTTWTWHKIGAGIAFYIGIVAALSIAWFGQRACRAAMGPISKLSGFWTSNFAYGAYDVDHHQAILDELASAAQKNKLAPFAGWLSLTSFTVGIALIGALEIQKSQPTTEKKNAVQQVRSVEKWKAAE